MSKVDPEIQLLVKEEVEKHSLKSDQLYAIKLVERIVFYAVGAASIGVLAALIRLVII